MEYIYNSNCDWVTAINEEIIAIVVVNLSETVCEVFDLTDKGASLMHRNIALYECGMSCLANLMTA